MILEEDIAEGDENIAIDWYLDYPVHIMTEKEYWNLIFIWHMWYLNNLISPPLE